MTEVEKFFRRLVSTMAASSPARLQGPLLLDDITGSILPYRTHRRALELDTVEDYEAVLLRLCAGEGDLVWTEPEDARKRFVEESRSNNPDLTALYAFENVYLSFRPEPLLWAARAGPPRRLRPARRPRWRHRCLSPSRPGRKWWRSRSSCSVPLSSRCRIVPRSRTPPWPMRWSSQPSRHGPAACTAVDHSPPTAPSTSAPTAGRARPRSSVPSAAARSSPDGGTASTAAPRSVRPSR